MASPSRSPPPLSGAKFKSSPAEGIDSPSEGPFLDRLYGTLLAPGTDIPAGYETALGSGSGVEVNRPPAGWSAVAEGP
jgi:hypothetical protein